MSKDRWCRNTCNNIIIFSGVEDECYIALDKIWVSMHGGVQGSCVVLFEGRTSKYKEEENLTEDEIEFYGHLKQWSKETVFLSSSNRKIQNPSYQAIVKMGEKAVPIILKHMSKFKGHGGHLSTALCLITGANPVTEEIAGRMARISEAWIRWGQKNWPLKSPVNVDLPSENPDLTP